MKRFACILSSVALLCTLALSALAAPAFSDVPGTWAEGSITRWAEAGVLNGDGAGRFRPADPVTRAELAQVLSNLLGLHEAAPAGTFADVESGAWYEQAVLCCAKAGILQGNGSGGADPLKPVTRQEAMLMLARCLELKGDEGSTLSGFVDADAVADWAQPAVAAMVGKKILTGVETAPGLYSLLPLAPIDRASLAALLDRAIPAEAEPEPEPTPSVVPSGGGGGGGGGASGYAYTLSVSAGQGGTVECLIDGVRTTRTNTADALVDFTITPQPQQGESMPYAVRDLRITAPGGGAIAVEPTVKLDRVTGKTTLKGRFSMSAGAGEYTLKVDFYQPIPRAEALIIDSAQKYRDLLETYDPSWAEPDPTLTDEDLAEHAWLAVGYLRDESLVGNTAAQPLSLASDALSILANGVAVSPQNLPAQSGAAVKPGRTGGAFSLYVDNNDVADPGSAKLGLDGESYVFDVTFVYENTVYKLTSERYVKAGTDPESLLTVHFLDGERLLASYTVTPGAHVAVPEEALQRAGWVHTGWTDADNWTNIAPNEAGGFTVSNAPDFAGGARIIRIQASFVKLERASLRLRPAKGAARDSDGAVLADDFAFDYAAAYQKFGVTLQGATLQVDQKKAVAYLKTCLADAPGGDDARNLAALRRRFRVDGTDYDLLYVGVSLKVPANMTHCALLAGEDPLTPGWTAIPEETSVSGGGSDFFLDESGQLWFIRYLPFLRADGTALEDNSYALHARWGTAEGPVKIEEASLARKTEPSRYTVTFVHTDTDWRDYARIGYGDALWMEPAKTRAGYVFTGWYFDEACTDLVPAADLGLEEGTRGLWIDRDLTLYAGWEEVWALRFVDNATQSWIVPGDNGAQLVGWNDDTGADPRILVTKTGRLVQQEDYPFVVRDDDWTGVDAGAYVPAPAHSPVTYYPGWSYARQLPRGYDRVKNPDGYRYFWPELQNSVPTGVWYGLMHLAPEEGESSLRLTGEDIRAMATNHLLSLDVDWHPTLALSTLTGEAAGDYAGGDLVITPDPEDLDVFLAAGTLKAGADGWRLPWKLLAFDASEGAGFTVAQVFWNEADELWETDETRAWKAADYTALGEVDYLIDLCPVDATTTWLYFAVNWDGSDTLEELVERGTILGVDCSALTFETP